MTHRGGAVPDSAIGRVLARAAELDAAQDSVSIDELRRIALDAGLAPDAVERALREFQAGLLTATPRPVPRTKSGGILSYWTSLLVPVGALTGFMSGAVDDLAFITVPGLVMAVTAAALEHRERGSTGKYVLVAALTWLVFGISVCIGLGEVEQEVFTVTTIAGAISTFAGAVITKAKRWWQQD